MRRRRRRVRTRRAGRGDRRARDTETGAHARYHRRGRLADRNRHAAHVAARDRRRRGVKGIHWADLSVMVMMRRRRHDRAQRVHPGKALAAQRRRHFGRPVVVRAVRAVESVGIRKRLGDEAVQTGCTEARLEIRRGLRGGVHRVTFLLPPFRPPILEPNPDSSFRKIRTACYLFSG